MSGNPARLRGPRGVVLAALCAAFAAYVLGGFCPSSYALVLRQFGAPDDGLVLGQPRLIRSDEFAVITPFIQATVNNGFERYNHTSFYGEDLRSTYSAPIKDWGLAFKPTFWGFLALPPAWAFSLHHGAVILMFLLGYWFLFERLGLEFAPAVLLSTILFFTGFVQYWWTTLGPQLAFFPWVLLIFLGRGSLWWRAPLAAWATCSWQLSSFYPPLTITEVFLAAALLLAFRPDALKSRSFWLAVAGGAVGLVLTIAYLHDWLQATLHTVYPGMRRVMGGTFSIRRGIAQLLPTANLHGHDSLIPGVNVCEAGVVGTFYTLMALLFLDLRRARSALTGQAVRRTAVLVVAILMIAAWQYLPVPSWLGAALLWNLVPASRFSFASGLLLFLLAWALAHEVGLRITLVRVLLFSALVFWGWWAFKYEPHHIGPWRAWQDIIIVAAVVPLWLAYRRGWLREARLNSALLGTSAIVAALSFGNFNPLQRATPIFERPETDVTRWLAARAAQWPDHRLAVGTYSGATLNGWGFASVSHVLTAPRVDYFRKLFPDMKEEELNLLFNRYEHVALSNEAAPRLIGPDAVLVPERAFTAPGSPRPDPLPGARPTEPPEG